MAGKVVMFVTNDASSDPRVEKEAAALAGAGFGVTVLAWDRRGAAERVEQRGGVTYERLGPRAPYGGGPRSVALFRAYWRGAAERATDLGPDVLHCHDLDTAPAGLAVQRRATSRPGLVLDMHELYRDSNMVPQRGLMGRAARAAVRVVERRAFRAADHILVANPGTVDYYRLLGVGGKVVLVENAPELERFDLVVRDPAASFTVGYFGQKRYPEGLRLLMEAIQPHAEMRAVLRGGGVAAGEVAALASGMQRVEASGVFKYAELPALYAECDVVYAVYDVALGNVRTLFPVKVMEAMASGLPVVVADGTWVGEYVVEHGIGVSIPAGDQEALEAALVRLASDPMARQEMGARGRAIIESGLNWDASSARLLEVYARWR